MKKYLGAGCVFLGAVLFSAKAILVKLAYTSDVDAVELLALRMIFSLPFFVIFALFRRKATARSGYRSPSANDYLWLVVFGLMGYYAASWFDFKGLEYITAGLERVILFIYPTIVIVLNAVLFRKKVTGIQQLALVLTYVGVFIAFGEEIHITGDTDTLWGALLIFGSAVTYAGYLVGSGDLIPKLGSVQYTALAMCVSSVAVVTHYFVFYDGYLLGFEPKVYEIAAYMAIFCTVIPGFLVSEGIRLVGSGNASIIGGVGPVSTIVLAYIFLNEQFGLFQLLGTLLVMVGVIVISTANKKPVAAVASGNEAQFDSSEENKK